MANADDRGQGDDSSTVSDAARDAALQELVRQLVSGEIVIRIENVEARERNLALQPAVQASADLGLGRRLLRAAITYCFTCEAVPIDFRNLR
jgi:hypothetical protein